MRAFMLGVASVLAGVMALSPAAAAQTSPQQALSAALSRNMTKLGVYSGAYVVDLSTGQPLYAVAPDSGRTPASVEKLYTTTTALSEFGPRATLTTTLLGTGGRSPAGTWYGTLYLRGGGDPTFGTTSFDRVNYSGGAAVQRLVSNLLHRTGITRLSGRIVGDASLFDSRPGTVEDAFRFDPYMEGALSGLTFNRDLLGDGNSYATRPAVFAAQQLAAALRSAHVRLARHQRVAGGRTPSSARVLATVNSPSMARLLYLTNTPSDNFFAEMLAKGIGARFGGAGTTAAGVAVIRSIMANTFHITPYMDDGSGLSRDDSTSPRQVVSLLAQMATNSTFVNSLAVAGETGTLEHEMNGTVAQGRCRGKTGTLSDVASLAGYCQAADGHTLAFAFLANRLGNSTLGHAIEANMAVSLAQYNG